MNLDDRLLESLRPEVEDIALRAGEAILEVYETAFEVAHKDDRSPLTAADMAAHRIIMQGLSALEPELPLLSEEASTPEWQRRRDWAAYWLVDPLDGTREFVKRNGEFTVNIALIEGHEPVLGVVHAPVWGETWSAARGSGAWHRKDSAEPRRIQARSLPETEPVVLASRSHPSERLQRFLERIGPHRERVLGSSLKMCVIAQGEADLYARLGPTSEWDTAAAHAVLREAGGDITDTTMRPLRYNTRETLLNPEFFAFGRESRDWSRYLDEAEAPAER